MQNVFDWIFFQLDSSGPSYRQSSRFHTFCALPRRGWCEGYSSRKSVGSSVLRSRVDFICFVLFLDAGGVRDTAVENRLAALCFARSSRAMRASRVTTPRPSRLVALGSAERRQSYVRGVALSREPPKLQQA